MKYKTFLDILFFIALLSTVIIMTVNNVEATPSNYYRVNVRIESVWTEVFYIGTPEYSEYIKINGVRVTNFDPPIDNMYNFRINHTINTITIDGVDGYIVIDSGADQIWVYKAMLTNATFRIYKNNTLIASGYGLGTHNLNLPSPSLPILPPPPVFELPSPPVLTPPANRPAFFNFTTLIPFFNFVDALFLPFAQVIINILWIFLGILDLINNTLINFWSFFDTHVMYSNFLDALGFMRMFFEIPEIMLLMVFGLSLIVIKIYLKR